MKKLAVILIFLVVSMAITPAFAVIQTFGTEKTIYKKGDKIVFTGITDTAHANKIVSIKVYGPDKSYVMLRETYANLDGTFKTNPFDTSIDKNAAKFTAKGVYNATAFYNDEPNYVGKFILFDYSADGSPVVPSAVELMKEKTILVPTTTTTTITQPALQPPKTETPKTEEPKTTTPPEEKPAEKPKTTIPGFPDPTKDPQTYVDRYNNEPAFKEWFTKYFPDESIYEVVGLPDPTKQVVKTTIPGFPDPTKDPQTYVDRYNNEPAFKEWFTKYFPDESIYEVVGLPDPTKQVAKTTIPGFPDPTKDPQTYVDRYNNEPEFKEWFTKYFPGKTIYEVVGIPEPKPPVGICGEGTVLENGICVIEKKSGGGCLVATATYGTELAPQVQHLRELRDSTLLKTNSGSAFMDGFNIFYYSFSPTIADWERQSPLFKETIKATLAPLLSSLSLLNYMHIDSEQELIVYGAGIILLNVGMYFILPAFVIVKIRKHIR